MLAHAREALASASRPRRDIEVEWEQHLAIEPILFDES